MEGWGERELVFEEREVKKRGQKRGKKQKGKKLDESEESWFPYTHSNLCISRFIVEYANFNEDNNLSWVFPPCFLSFMSDLPHICDVIDGDSFSFKASFSLN